MKESLISDVVMKKRNRNNVVLLKMQIFTDEQELI